MVKRPPDVIIGELDNPYLYRWWIIPKNRFFNIYLHRFLRSDDDRALHDHPWWSLGVILHGAYNEVLPDHTLSEQIVTDYDDLYGLTEKRLTRWESFRGVIRILRHRFQPVVRRAEHIHRVELLRDGTGAEIPVWTLFITGPKIRDWGFWCPKGFKHWELFVKKHEHQNGNHAGAGCDD